MNSARLTLTEFLDELVVRVDEERFAQDGERDSRHGVDVGLLGLLVVLPDRLRVLVRHREWCGWDKAKSRTFRQGADSP